MSPQLAQEVLLDEVNDAVLVNMMWETQMYLYEKRDSLQSLAKLLLNNWNHKQIHESYGGAVRLWLRKQTEMKMMFLKNDC